MRINISPTPSNTPSNTPSITPSASNCPVLFGTVYSNVYWCDGDETEPIGDYNITLTYSGNTYPYTQYSGGTYLATECLYPVEYPVSGLTYSFVVNIPEELEACSVSERPAYDRVDFTVGDFMGYYPLSAPIVYWTGHTIYYLNNVPVYYPSPDLDYVAYLPPSSRSPYNGCEYSLYFSEMVIGPQFPLKKKTFTPTPTNTATQTMTPTNTATPTQTIPAFCPEQVIISSGTSTMTQFEGTYNRVYTYTGGSMNYGYYQQTIPDFIIGTAPNSLNYVVYKEQSSNRFITRQFNSTTDRGWSFYTGSTSTYGSPVSGGLIIGFTGTTTNGSERYIKSGYNVSNVFLTNSFVATFPSICPTSTPTITPTNTMTPTPTRTIGLTPTMTQTQTNTATQTKTPTNTPTNTPSVTQTSTPTGTIVVTPTSSATPTITPTLATLCIDVQTNVSLDVTLNYMTVNGNAAYVTGGVWPNTPGNGATLSVAGTPGTYDVEIFYTSFVPGQHIAISSPLTGYACQNTTTGSGSVLFTSVGFNTLSCLQVIAQDGTC